MLFKSRKAFSTLEPSTFNLAHFKQCQSVFNGKYAHPEPSRGSFQQITLSLIHHLWHLATFCLQLLKQPACFRLHLDREIPFSTLVSHFLSRPRGVKFWVLGSPLQAGVGRTLCRQGGRCPAHGSQHRWCSWCSPWQLQCIKLTWCPHAFTKIQAASTDLGLNVREAAPSDDRDEDLGHVCESLKHLNIEQCSHHIWPVWPFPNTSFVAGGRTVRSGWAPWGARVPS